jgi:hypothetical protein
MRGLQGQVQVQYQKRFIQGDAAVSSGCLQKKLRIVAFFENGKLKMNRTISTQHTAHSTQHTAHSTQHSALSTQHSALSTQHSALSTQHSALSTQHSALSTQHSALNLRGLISRSSVPAAFFRRRLISVVTIIVFSVVFPAQAETDICSLGNNGSYSSLKQAQGLYDDKWAGWKAAYYNTATPEKDKKEIRDRYIDARLAIFNEQFRIFASDICERGAGPEQVANALLKVQKRRYDGLEARLVFNRLRALVYTKTSNIEKSMGKGTAAYSLLDAEQDLSGLDWPLVLYTAINDVEKIKWDALQTAASGEPAN